MPGKILISRLWLILHLAVLFICLLTAVAQTALAQGAPVSVVSAASYEQRVAPDSIAAAFGKNLATITSSATPGAPLPTELGGTTLEINGRRAPLFFVAPDQINFLVPAETALGAAAVVVRAGDGTVSRGTATVDAVRPGIFTADSSGKGAPAAILLRVRADNTRAFEPLTRPINLGPTGERVFLILFLTGIRGALDLDRNGSFDESIRLSLDGADLTPSFVGRQGDFVGLDQLNVELPRSLSGRGPVDLSVTFYAQAVSNPVRVEVGGPPPPEQPRITGLSRTSLLVGDELVINGADFAANANENEVSVVDDQGQGFRAKLLSASSTQLRVRVPFGAGSGVVRVRTSKGAGVSSRITVRTSVSGFVETTINNPLPGVIVKLRETNIRATTDTEGRFILPDAPAKPSADVELDASQVPVTFPFPPTLIKVRVIEGRDRHLERISLQQGGGLTIRIGEGTTLAATSPNAAPGTRIERDGVVFEVADGVTATFPGGATSGDIGLTVLTGSRAPVPLPPGIFSQSIAQLTPFGVRLAPGGTLTFPNRDNLPAGAQPTLYRLDQTPGSPTLGQFIPAGMATVSADGRRVETAANAITETSVYFAAAPRPTTTVIGRVVDSDGVTPVRQALVRARGQETATNGLGEFALPNVAAANATDLLTVEVGYQRPNGRIDRVQRGGIAPVLGGVTNLTQQPLVLPAENSNRPPAIIVADFLTLPESSPTRVTDVMLVIYDPDPEQTVQATLTGPTFASLVRGAGDSFTLRLNIGLNLRGDYTLRLTATDNLGLASTQNITLRIFVPGPQEFLAPGVSVRFGTTPNPPINTSNAVSVRLGQPPPSPINPSSALSVRFGAQPPTTPVSLANALSVRFGAAANTTPVNPSGAVSVRFGAQPPTPVNPTTAVSVERRAPTANAAGDAASVTASDDPASDRASVTPFASVSVSKAPVVLSLSLAQTQIAPGQTVVVTITGLNLSGATALKFIGEDGLPDATLAATLLAANAEGTALTVIVTASAEAKPGRRVVQITAAVGSSSLAASDANVIEVGK